MVAEALSNLNFYVTFFYDLLGLVYVKILCTNRLLDTPVDQCYASIDGTDCTTEKPIPRSSSLYSCRINGPAVRYEVADSIQKTKIDAVRGP